MRTRFGIVFLSQVDRIDWIVVDRWRGMRRIIVGRLLSVNDTVSARKHQRRADNRDRIARNTSMFRSRGLMIA
jgi:hypothetical protein